MDYFHIQHREREYASKLFNNSNVFRKKYSICTVEELKPWLNEGNIIQLCWMTLYCMAK